ncbi:hypothetical protein [Helicobacter sp.]|nr:hypothetical protein [Helicobacter sp.]MBR2495219.1 hypothetical protein [Helicobacter sp.]
MAVRKEIARLEDLLNGANSKGVIESSVGTRNEVITDFSQRDNAQI